MDVCCECSVLSGRGLCDELITRPEKSYRPWSVVVCDLETSWMRTPWPTEGGRVKNKTKTVTHSTTLVSIGRHVSAYYKPSSDFTFPRTINKIFYCNREWKIYASPVGREKFSGGTHASRDVWGIWLVSTLTLLTRSTGWAPNNASKWKMGFNLAFKVLRWLATSRRLA